MGLKTSTEIVRETIAKASHPMVNFGNCTFGNFMLLDIKAQDRLLRREGWNTLLEDIVS